MARYITPTIAYVNAPPHVGYALELVQTDALARFWRLQGEEVFFNTGADEHGQKIWEAAKKKGQDVQEYVDYYAEELRKLGPALNLSANNFVRTTDPKHKKAAQEMWRRCEAAGDIYKKAYTGLYCIGCEAFKTERELENGRCTLHPSLELQTITEENYFFRFSRYTDRLLEYLSRPDCIAPEWRRQEAIEFVKKGLEDFSISREKARLPWGVPVEGDDSQVYYVWFDALVNYLSTLGWPDDAEGKFKKFWEGGTTYQTAGKDQVRFQSIMWQAILMSAEIRNTDHIFYHGFITSGGERMSKSLGNVISPYDLVKKYGVDATRYLLLRHVHPTEDSDVTWDKLDEWYTANLTNGLGNLIARVLTMSEKYQVQFDFNAPDAYLSDLRGYELAIEEFKFNEACDAIWSEVQKADKYIQETEPFKLISQEGGRDKAIAVLAELVFKIRRIGVLLQPFLPESAEKILTAVKQNKKPENLFPRLA
jgi:methionyl-tRNA synthetase